MSVQSKLYLQNLAVPPLFLILSLFGTSTGLSILVEIRLYLSDVDRFSRT